MMELLDSLLNQDGSTLLHICFVSLWKLALRVLSSRKRPADGSVQQSAVVIVPTGSAVVIVLTGSAVA